MVKYIAPVLLAVFMMVFLNISHAQQPFVDRFIVLELDLTKSDVVKIWASGSQENRYWAIPIGSNITYRFISDKKVPKWAVSRTHHALGFAEFEIQLEKWAKTGDIYDFASGRRQFEHLYIKEISEEGVRYYHAKFQYEHMIVCAG